MFMMHQDFFGFHVLLVMLCDSDIDASFVDHAFQELYSDNDEAGRIKR
jgi:hypothetical protein